MKQQYSHIGKHKKQDFSSCFSLSWLLVACPIFVPHRVCLWWIWNDLRHVRVAYIVTFGDTWNASAICLFACFIMPVIFTLAGHFYLAKLVCIFDMFVLLPHLQTMSFYYHFVDSTRLLFCNQPTNQRRDEFYELYTYWWIIFFKNLFNKK